jgi:hypothetical protein
LLSRFTDASGQLVALNLARNRERPTYPKGAAYEIDFVAHEATEAEQLWGEVERKLPSAFEAVDQGKVFEIPGAAETLKEAIALHFMRRLAVKDIAERIYASAPDRIAALSVPAAFKDREKYLKETVLMNLRAEQDAIWSENIRLNFRRARERVAESGLGLLWSETPLAIGDSAVLSERRGKIGFAAFAEAGTHLLPIGRHHLAVLAPSNRQSSLPAARADELNRFQALNARTSVFYHPEDNLREFFKAVRDELPGRDAF